MASVIKIQETFGGFPEVSTLPESVRIIYNKLGNVWERQPARGKIRRHKPSVF
jgi:hypothetical protein